jgi:hypothetical protein
VNERAFSVLNDTLSLLLTNQFHKELDDKHRAMKIAKCCKVVRDRTKDDLMLRTCKQLIKATSNGEYTKVLKYINGTQNAYFQEFGTCQ